MTTNHRIALEEEPQPKEMGAIVQGLTEYSRLHTGGARHALTKVLATAAT